MRVNTAELLQMLTYCRPAGSDTERSFINRYIASLPDAWEDAYNNWHVVIGDSPILWSCHTDTVHRSGGRQTVHVDAKTNIVTLSKRSKHTSACLGADDTAGVWLMRSMVLAHVPGHYVFHYGEEIGGEGSQAIAHDWPAIVSDATFAIALDRQGYGDVITHQMGRTASDAFAESLADQLNAHGLKYAPSDRGVFTDTAHYTDAIGECSNVSVGYGRQHSRDEWLDVGFIALLLPALCAIDASALVASRKAGEYEHWSETTFVNSPRLAYSSSLAPASYAFTETDIYCEYCGIEYDPERSDADLAETYCGYECELADYRVIERRLADRSDSVYLDPCYQDVQDALRRQS